MAIIDVKRNEWRATRNVLLATVATVLITGCTLKSDAQYSAEQSRLARERGVRGMQLATQQTPRGADLAGEALRAAVAGKVLVNRYESAPGGAKVPYVIRRQFAADGRFSVSDEPNIIGARADDAHRWRVDGPRLCVKGPPSPQEWKCWRMARTANGALQWYIDEPGTSQDGLLTIVTTEIVDLPR